MAPPRCSPKEYSGRHRKFLLRTRDQTFAPLFSFLSFLFSLLPSLLTQTYPSLLGQFLRHGYTTLSYSIFTLFYLHITILPPILSPPLPLPPLLTLPDFSHYHHHYYYYLYHYTTTTIASYPHPYQPYIFSWSVFHWLPLSFSLSPPRSLSLTRSLSRSFIFFSFFVLFFLSSLFGLSLLFFLKSLFVHKFRIIYHQQIILLNIFQLFNNINFLWIVQYKL